MSGVWARRVFGASRTIAAMAMILAPGTEALAHTSERGHVMLLPTGYYLAGGALAVAMGFLVLAVVPPAPLDRLFRWRLRLMKTVRFRGRTATSAASFAFLVILIAAGLAGSRDPLSNPLPLTVWTLFWVGLTLLHGLFGNLWAWINPWYAPYRLALSAGWRPSARLPEQAGYWLAFLGFFAFAWFELVYPAPDDPWRLALVVSLYWLAHFAAMLLFGYEEWMRRGEPFSVFFGMIARLAVVDAEAKPSPRVSLCLPGAQLAAAPALPPSGVLFLLLALSSVSFDGLMRTFFWLGANGVNPLEFPGRSAVIGINTTGLIGMFALLTLGFYFAVLAGERLWRNEQPFPFSTGALVWSIMPISLAYHFSHYLVALLVNVQYALVTLSDPFARGWNLFGTADWHIHAGVTAGHESAWAIWNAQAAAIIGGHVLAIIAAHAIAYRLQGSRRRAVLSQIPLAGLMVSYTVFGLWLLSTPTAG
jgi:hypothetical protein